MTILRTSQVVKGPECRVVAVWVKFSRRAAVIVGSSSAFGFGRELEEKTTSR
jgi:hypothetical protein